jgi:hypothetical protein
LTALLACAKHPKCFFFFFFRFSFFSKFHIVQVHREVLMNAQFFVMFGGSRALPARFAGLVRSVAAAVLAAGGGISAGCAAGADQFAVTALWALGAAPLLRLACLGYADGAGFWSGSAPFPVLSSAAAAGAQVAWCAGGGPRVPFEARLLRRSLAALAGCRSAVFFLSSVDSRGSLRVAAAAVSAGIPVFVFTCGFSGKPLPPRGCSGRWVPASFFSFSCLRWQPAAQQIKF